MNVLARKLARLSIAILIGGATILCPLHAALSPSCFAQEGDDDREVFVAVKAGRIITVCGEEIEGGTIVIRNGKIEAVGKNVEIPWGAKVIDAPDLVVMPGLVHPWTRHGLRSYSRSGTRTNLTAADELYPEEDTFEDLLEAGFTTAGLYPNGSGLPGQASAIRPIPGSADEIVIKKEAYIRVPFTRPSGDKRALRDNLKKAKAEIEKVEKARKAWEEKKKADEKKDAPPKKEPPKKEPPKEGEEKGEKEKKEPEEFKPPPINPTLKPLVDLIQKKEGVRALVEFARAEGYLHFQDILEEYEIAHVYQIQNPKISMIREFGGRSDTDAGLIADRMGKEKPLVLLFAEITWKPYTSIRTSLPLEFHKAGCEIALSPVGSSRQGLMLFREKVAELIKHGLPRQAALEAITHHPARILGLGDRLGTIEKERDANLIFLDGDPFAANTRVVKVMVEGKVVAEPETMP